MMDENFYIQLKLFFKRKNITQQQIASRLGVSQTYVNSLLCGKRNFGRKSAQEWQDAFGISMIWLLTGEGEMMAGGAAAVNTINIDARGNRVNASGSATAVQAVGGSSVTPAGGDASTVAQLLDQNAQLIEQNKKLIDLLAASYKNNQ